MQSELATLLPSPGELLPHRPPMLQIDAIESFTPGEGLMAVKEILPDNPFLEGHFPDYPLMPGVMLIEMMFQACGLYGRLQEMQEKGNQLNGEKKMGRAIKVNEAVFKGEVRPPARLEIKVDFKQKIFSFSTFSGSIKSGDKVVAEAVITVFI